MRAHTPLCEQPQLTLTVGLPLVCRGDDYHTDAPIPGTEETKARQLLRRSPDRPVLDPVPVLETLTLPKSGEMKPATNPASKSLRPWQREAGQKESELYLPHQAM